MKNTIGAPSVIGQGAIVLMLLSVIAFTLFAFREIKLEQERFATELAEILTSEALNIDAGSTGVNTRQQALANKLRELESDNHRLAATIGSRSWQLMLFAGLCSGIAVMVIFYTRRRVIHRRDTVDDRLLAQARVPTAPLTMPADDAPAELAAFDWELGLAHVAGEVRLFRRLLRDFVSRAPDFEARLGAVTAGDATTAQDAAHNLKGVAGNLGAAALCAAAEALERRLRNHGAVSADAALTDTLERLTTTVQVIQTTLARMPQPESTDAPPIDRLALREELLALAQLLRDGNAAACDRVEALWVHLDAFVPEQSERLEEQIMNYDFDEAHQTVQQITQRLLQNESEEDRS